jgi:hypothetical protein
MKEKFAKLLLRENMTSCSKAWRGHAQSAVAPTLEEDMLGHSQRHPLPLPPDAMCRLCPFMTNLYEGRRDMNKEDDMWILI